MKPIWQILKSDQPSGRYTGAHCIFYTFLYVFYWNWIKTRSLTTHNKKVLLKVTKENLGLSTYFSEWQTGSGIKLKQTLHKWHKARNKQSHSTYLVGLCSHNPSACPPCRSPSELGPHAPTPPRLQVHPCPSSIPETKRDLPSAPAVPGYLTTSLRIRLASASSTEEEALRMKKQTLLLSPYQWIMYWLGSFKMTKNRSCSSLAIPKSHSVDCLH